jgi:uncharacterized protein YjiS (DUF1127 family)
MGRTRGTALVSPFEIGLEDAMTSNAKTSNCKTSNIETWKTVGDPFGRTILAVAGAAWAGVKTLAKSFEHRRDAAFLAQLDDRMLADIGLTRGDLRDALSEPPWRDPTALLVVRAGERRTHRRRAGSGLARDVVAAPSIVADAGCDHDLTGAAMSAAH